MLFRSILPYGKVIQGWPAFVISACSELKTPNSDRQAVQSNLPAPHLLTTLPAHEHDIVGFKEVRISCDDAHNRIPDGIFLVNADALDHLTDRRFDVAGDHRRTGKRHDEVKHIAKGHRLGQRNLRDGLVKSLASGQAS